MAFIHSLNNWFIEKKKLWRILGGSLLIFAVGFGNGYLLGSGQKIASKRLNYTTNPTAGKGTEAIADTNTKPQSAAKTSSTSKQTTAATKSGADGFCYIKGNIASGGKKTYHMPGGSFYDRTTPEQCFSSEAEAKAAGFTKSSR
jgi:hypothetical protein